jgi:tol-pal system protein YbgF
MVGLPRKRRKTCIFAGLLFCVIFLIALNTHAQTPRDFTNRIEHLENEIETLNRAVYRGEKPPAPSFNAAPPTGRAQADMQVRLQQLENEIRHLRGTLEEQNNQIRTMRTTLERSMSDMDMRIGDLENKRGGAHLVQDSGITTYDRNAAPVEPGDDRAQSTIAPTTPDTTPAEIPQRRQTLSDDQAAMAYEDAFAKLKAGQYDTAGQNFMTFLNAYPDHVLAGNAKYWLGETFYVRGDFERAARVFAEGYKEYPNSSKTADNLLKLALSLAALENKEDACVALAQLKDDFADSPGPVTRRGEEESLRLGCP